MKNKTFRGTNRNRPKLRFAIRGVGYSVERVVKDFSRNIK